MKYNPKKVKIQKVSTQFSIKEIDKTQFSIKEIDKTVLCVPMFGIEPPYLIGQTDNQSESLESIMNFFLPFFD